MKTQKGAPCGGYACSGRACDLWLDDTSGCQGFTFYTDAFDNIGTGYYFCSDDCYRDAFYHSSYCPICKRRVLDAYSFHLDFIVCDKCDFERKIGKTTTPHISARVPNWALAWAHYHPLKKKVIHNAQVSLLIRGDYGTTFARADPARAIGAALLLLAATRFDKGSLFGQGLPMDVARLVARRVYAQRFAREWLELDLL